MKHIKELREEKGISQQQLAEILSIHRTAVAKYESETISAKTEMLEKLADIFNVSTDYLLGRTDEKSPSLNRDRLDEEEWKALELFMGLNAEGRLSALTMLRALADSPAYKKSAVSGQIQAEVV